MGGTLLMADSGTLLLAIDTKVTMPLYLAKYRLI
jgi:hypothetical protein